MSHWRAVALLLGILPGGIASADADAEPIRAGETIVVTATRDEIEIEDAAASVIVLDAEDLSVAAPVALDEKLRQVPGLTLFRRSGSRFAHPTAQGVSLRGIGASGASRALVLDDGVPLNDPFGGWIYWNLVPLETLDRVEVLRGGGSDLYGASALGGVIQLVRSSPSEDRTSGGLSWGSDRTLEASAFTARVDGPWRWSAAGSGFTTDGYVPVPAGERGAVDRSAASQVGTAELGLARDHARGAWSLRASWMGEARDNGTRLQVNETRVVRLVGAADRRVGESLLEMRAFGGTRVFESAFSAVAEDRDSETLVRLQRVPVDDFGVSLTWHAPPRGRHEWLAGADARLIDGESRETVVLPAATIPAASGGEQQLAGMYVQDLVRSGRLTATAALRLDWWRNAGGFERSGGGTREHPDSTETALSPRASVLWSVSETTGLAISAYRSFRAPTLNELYRGFRVGDVVTDPNPALGPERLGGVEAGVNVHSGTTAVRGRVFWNRVDDPVANVTLRVTPALVERQRRNLGATRSAGVEIDAEVHPLPNLEIRGAALFAESEVLEFDAEPGLEGNRVPQVPESQWTLSATWRTRRGLVLASQVRRTGMQFEDDRNELELGAFTTVDLYASFPLGDRLAAFLAADNVLDERFVVGRTPIPTLGPPRLVRVGLKLRR